MKTLVVIFVLIAGPALASFKCGMAPIASIGCRYVCMCDSAGNNCGWVTVC